MKMESKTGVFTLTSGKMPESNIEEDEKEHYLWPQYVNTGYDDTSTVISLGSTIDDPMERERLARQRQEKIRKWKEQNRTDANYPALRTKGTVSTSSAGVRTFQTFEEVLKAVGSFGRYQKFAMLLIQYASVMWVGNVLLVAFATELRPTGWECRNKSNENVTDIFDESEPDFCQRLSQCRQNSEISKLVPIEPFLATFVGEWRLVCDLNWVVDFMTAMVSVGRIVGYLIGGHIADRYGRQRVLFGSQLVICVLSTMVTASASWEAATTLLSLTGCLFGIVDVVAIVLILEMVDSRHRMLGNVVFQWGLGYLVVALIAWLCPDWRLYLIVINFTAAPLLVGYLLIHESPRWLIQMGKTVEAADILTDLASDRWNRRGIEVVSRQLINIHREPTTVFYTSYHLFFKSKEMCLRSLLMLLAVFTYSCVNNSVVGNLDEVFSNPFLCVALFGLIRLPIPFLLVGLDWKFHGFGRRALFLGSLAVVAVANLVIVVSIGVVGAESLLSSAFLIIATCVNASALYMAIVQSIVEIYPTVIRSVAMGTLFIADDIGNIVTTHLLEWDSSWSPMSYLIVEVLLIFLIVAVYLGLPETKEKKLQDTFQTTLTRPNSFYVL